MTIARFETHSLLTSEKCGICLSDMHENLVAHRAGEIYHIFHQKCIQKAVAEDPKCPICRQPASIDMPFWMKFAKEYKYFIRYLKIASVALAIWHLHFTVPKVSFFCLGALICTLTAKENNLGKVAGLVAGGLLSEVVQVGNDYWGKDHWGYAFCAGAIAVKTFRVFASMRQRPRNA